MPSFDVVSEVNEPELRNAVDQVKREIGTRFDLKGTSASVDLNGLKIELTGDSEFHLEQIFDIFRLKLAKRGVDIACLDPGEPVKSGMSMRLEINVRQGIDQDLAKRIQRIVKDSKLKVQASLQGEQIRITGKKRDDLQSVITILRGQTFDRPLQYNNFRD